MKARQIDCRAFPAEIIDVIESTPLNVDAGRRRHGVKHRAGFVMTRFQYAELPGSQNVRPT
jgi:hypothetical protein